MERYRNDTVSVILLLRILVSAVLTLSFSVGRSNTGRATAERLVSVPMSASQAGVYPVSDKDISSVSTVHYSPTGRYLIAASDEQTAGFLVRSSKVSVVIDTTCIQKQDLRNCSFKIEGLDSARIISWSSTDSYFYFVDNNHQIDRAVINSPTSVIITERVPVFKDALLALNDMGTTSARSGAAFSRKILALYGKASELKKSKTILNYGIFHGKPYFILSDKHTLNTSVTIGPTSKTLPVDRPFLSYPKIIGRQSNEISIVDTGWKVPVSNAYHNEAHLESLEYKNIVDGPDDCLELRYTYKELLFKCRSPLINSAKTAIVNILMRFPSLYISDMSFFNDSYTAILRDTFGRTTLIYGNKRATREFGERDYQDLTAPVTMFENLGSEEWPIVSAIIKPKITKGTVFYFGGGPAVSIANSMGSYTVRSYLDRGYTVVVVGYSGSVGAGVSTSNRLAAYGATSFIKDRDAVSNYVTKKDLKGPIIVHGESFGGAAALAAAVGIVKAKPILIEVAPFFVPRDPRLRVSDDSFHSINYSFQGLWERSAFGIKNETDRKAFSETVASFVKSIPCYHRSLVILSKGDNKSQIEDIPSSLLCDNNAMYVNSSHSFITASPVLWRLIDLNIGIGKH